MSQPPTQTSTAREGFTKCTLPMPPAASVGSRIPLESDRTFKSQQQCTADAALLAVAEYNRCLARSGNFDAERRAMLSGKVLSAMTNINRTVEQARSQVQKQVEVLNAAIAEFAGHVKQGGGLDFNQPSWMEACAQDISAAMSHIREEKAAETVQAVLGSLPDARRILEVKLKLLKQARREIALHQFYGKLETILNRLLTWDQGHYHAFELYFSIKINALLADYSAPKGLCRVETCLLGLLHGTQVTSTTSGNRLPDLDFANAARRLRESMRKRGCTTDAFPPIRGLDPGACCCHRQKCLHLLQELQKRALAQVRVKVLLTMNNILPIELCDLIIGFALVVEEVPKNPQVMTPGSRRYGILRLRVGQEQGVFPEYRCPRFRKAGDPASLVL